MVMRRPFKIQKGYRHNEKFVNEKNFSLFSQMMLDRRTLAQKGHGKAVDLAKVFVLDARPCPTGVPRQQKEWFAK
ncbi:hypothetical protein [uncultured Martelella sp.]|uniref:hypothetical protein n=1 Tax=uncultured Martelella sp. TaxID=392331 RepID=UPI0029C851DC|nr:hypothetical protein [uncultured Martelella sp.]